MLEVFEKLRSLQDVLSEKIHVENEIKEIPKALATKKELLNRMKKSYIEKNEKYQAIKEQMKTIQKEMVEAETQREGFEEKMDLIKTQREYEALDKEIKDATEREQYLRREHQKKQKKIEELEDVLEREEQMIEKQQSDLEEEQTRIDEKTSEKQEQLDGLGKKEDEISPGLEDEILFKFERIIRNKAGLGIVPVKKGVCTGCHMILPVQFVNDIHEGEGILFCPYCSRILFFEDAPETEQEFVDNQAGSLADLVDDDELLAE